MENIQFNLGVNIIIFHFINFIPAQHFLFEYSQTMEMTPCLYTCHSPSPSLEAKLRLAEHYEKHKVDFSLSLF